MEFATLNANLGPIYIGKDSEVMEGALIRGPFAMCERSFVKMGARVYGPTTVGPYCSIGGEVRNAVFFAHSNKAHDGFLGNAVIGEWCNMGADTNCSNLVSANVFGSGFPRTFIPSFSWGGAAGLTTYLTKKAFEVAEVVMARRQIELTDEDKAILEHVFELSKKFRRD